MPESVSAPQDSGSVEFNCSATVSLTFFADGQNVSTLPDSREITSIISETPDTVSGVLSVSTIEENNNTEILCRLTSGGLQSTSAPALLTITECKLAIRIIINFSGLLSVDGALLPELAYWDHRTGTYSS